MKARRRSHIEVSHQNQKASRRGVRPAKPKDTGAQTHADAKGKIIDRDGIQRDITDRKQAEEALRASEERFRLLSENAVAGILISNVEGKILYANKTSARMLEFDTVDELLAVTMASRYKDPNARENFIHTLRSQGSVVNYEIEMLTQTGRIITTLNGVRLDEGTLFGTIIDITERKQAEKALHASETRFKELIARLPTGVLLQGTRAEILISNQAALDMLGLTENQLLGKSSFDPDWNVIHEDGSDFPGSMHPVPISIATRLPVRNVVMGVYRPKHRDRVWLLVNAEPYLNTDGSVRDIICTFSDITERKQAEEKVRESEASLEALVENADGSIWSVDDHYRLITSNTRFRRNAPLVLGREIQKGDSVLLDSLPEEIRTLWRERYDRALRGENFVTEDATRYLPEQRFIEHHFSPIRDKTGKIVGATVFGLDLTARKRAEEKIERQNQRLKVLRDIDTAILAADSVENIVRAALDHICELIDCRRAALSLFNWGTNEAVFFDVKTVNETSVPKGMHVPLALFQDMIQIFSKNEPVLINDLNALADPPPQIQSIVRDGLRSLCNLPLFSQGNLIGAFSLSSEISGFFDEEKIDLGREVANQVTIAITQRNLLQALRELNAELEQRVTERTSQLQAANKELEAFSYSVSHDLRAPLRAIGGFSQALARKYAEQLGQEGEHYLTRIQENTHRMGQLIDDLLSLARITRRELQQDDVDLSKLAREIAAELQAQEPARRVDFAIEEYARARGDAGLLNIVLHNLLGNAWKFTSARAEARIHFGMLPSAKGSEAGGEGTVFFVRDNGVGFDMAYADKLFGAFQRLHRMDEFPGTGIGLATVQRIVHRHGGRVWAEAAQDNGAAFYFTLGGNHEK